MISTTELMTVTGASSRQINYWCGFVFGPEGSPNPGSGRNREWPEEIVPKVNLLVSVSKAFGGNFSVDSLKLIYDNYDAGQYDFGNGIVLTWPVNVVRTIACHRCKKTVSETWWKCCPRHVNEHGDDVMCDVCVRALHPINAVTEADMELIDLLDPVIGLLDPTVDAQNIEP